MSAFSTTSTSSGTDCCVTISRANLSVAATPTDSTVASPTGCSSISPPPESFVVVWKTKLPRYYFSFAYQYYSIISGATSRCHSAHSGMDHFALCLVFGWPNLDGLGTTSLQYSFFFFKCHSRTVPFSVGGFSFFQFHFAYPLLPSGGATGLRGTFHGHPRPFYLTFTDIHNTYTPMGAYSRRDSNPC
jgi:hypothetical protein